MIKEFKSGDGCRFMCTCLPGSTSVFDMDVDDGVEVSLKMSKSLNILRSMAATIWRK